MSFASLGLGAPLLDTLATLAYLKPTPVQTAAIPAVLAGRDLMAAAQTGTGKTAAFALPLLQRLAAGGPPVAANSLRALVLTPTRELAEQVHESLRAYGRNLPLRTYAVYGGVSINPQMMALRKGIDVVVATPGRLLDSELLFTGRAMTAGEGLAWGFFNALHGSDALAAAAQSVADSLVNGPTFAHGMTKTMLNQEWSMTIEQAIEAEAQAQAICMQTHDFHRAYHAFAAKQKPVFEGN